jgi:uncharacterized protein (TIGR02147 family)
MNIYRKTDYRLILKEVIAERKKLDSTINFQKMASQIRVPKSYLSRVLGGHAELNNDQIFMVCEFLEFNDHELTYMNLLVDYARSAINSRKIKLLGQIREIQALKLDSKSSLSASEMKIDHEDIEEYYLNPLIQLIHVCLAIPRYQKDQILLATDLRVSISKVITALSKLERMGLVKKIKGELKIQNENLHLAKSSRLFKPWRNQLKLMSINRIEAIPDDQSYSFSVIFSGTEDLKKEIQSRFLEFLKGIEGLTKVSPQEEVYQMGFELFPWTKS